MSAIIGFIFIVIILVFLMFNKNIGNSKKDYNYDKTEYDIKQDENISLAFNKIEDLEKKLEEFEEKYFQ